MSTSQIQACHLARDCGGPAHAVSARCVHFMPPLIDSPCGKKMLNARQQLEVRENTGRRQGRVKQFIASAVI